VKQIFLDCDGVLADFDTAAIRIFGQHPQQAEDELGSVEFWRRLRESGRFFHELPLLTDGLELYRAVAHLHPVILTGCPRGGWAEPDKVAWAARHFPNVAMITCLSRDKRLHMNPGDVLVDDFLKYKQLWEDAGGIFIHHTSAEESLRQLAALGFDVRSAAFAEEPTP
jgi:FMN phosphatase YigB (HAD superfamily)